MVLYTAEDSYQNKQKTKQNKTITNKQTNKQTPNERTNKQNDNDDTIR